MSILTVDQLKWQDLNRQLMQLRPSKLPPRPDETLHPVRARIFDIISDKRGMFAKVMTGVLIINVLIICTEFYMEPQVAPNFFIAREAIVLGLVVCYLVELLLKVIAQGPLGVSSSLLFLLLFLLSWLFLFIHSFYFFLILSPL